MKKPLAVLVVLTVSLAGSLAAAAAGSGGGAKLLADLVLRPGVGRIGHPAVAPPGLYGGLDATYYARRGVLTWSLGYKGLKGAAIRVAVRSRATGRTYAVLCAPCRPVQAQAGNDKQQVSRLSSTVVLDPDTAFLVTQGRTFVEVDTTAYPAGEIGGPIVQAPTFGPGHYGESPRCC